MATFLPTPVGFNIMGKQTLIMNVSIWFLLFEGLFFLLRREREREKERERERERIRLRPGAAGRRVTQELLTARASVLTKPLPHGCITFFGS